MPSLRSSHPTQRGTRRSVVFNLLISYAPPFRQDPVQPIGRDAPNRLSHAWLDQKRSTIVVSLRFSDALPATRNFG